MNHENSDLVKLQLMSDDDPVTFELECGDYIALQKSHGNHLSREPKSEDCLDLQISHTLVTEGS